MRHPEKVHQFVVERPFEIDGFLYGLRLKLDKHLKDGPVVFHMSRQLLECAQNGDGKEHLLIMRDYRANRRRPFPRNR